MTNYSSWNISENDFPADASLKHKIMHLCGYGVLAPSVHNSQPWRFEVGAGHVIIHLAKERLLGAGDPTGRESWISLGSCVENILLAGNYFGIAGSISYLNDQSVTITFAESKPIASEAKLLRAIVQRATNRGPYTPKPVPKPVIQNLLDVSIPGTHVSVQTDRAFIGLIADLTSRAIGMALSNPSFRQELSSLIRSNWTKSSTGMPGFSLGVSGIRSAVEHRLVKSGALVSAQAKKEHENMNHSAAIVLVFTDGDTPKYWLAAGRAYQRAGLITTANGLSCATTAATVEAADFHLDIEQRAKTVGRLQAVMRIGYSQSPARHSPRLGLDAVATFSS